MKEQKGSLSLGIGLLVFLVIAGVSTFRSALNEDSSFDVVDNPMLEDKEPEVKGDVEVKPTPEVTINQDIEKGKNQEEQQFSREEFLYPGAELINENKNQLELSSLEEPSEITSWYEAAFRSLNYKITSFVKTNSNGEVKNELMGADSSAKILVKITKEKDAKITSIRISIGG